MANNKFEAVAQRMTSEARLKSPSKAGEGSESSRLSLPQVRVLGTNHPREFAQDLDVFIQKYKFREGKKNLSQSELVEVAFYYLRKTLEGTPAPKWLLKLSDELEL